VLDNVALNKTTFISTSSSYINNMNYANDGELDTCTGRWSSSYYYNPWWAVDLGVATRVHHVNFTRIST